MGFLLGLDHFSLTKMSPKCSKSSDVSIFIGDVNHPTVYKSSSKNKDSNQHLPKRLEQESRTNDAQSCSKPWMKVNEVASILDSPQPESCIRPVVDENSNEVAIQQCLRRTLSCLNAKPNSNEKLSLVKINRATSQIVSGVKYTVDFDTKDEITGKSYSTEATIVSQPWNSEDPAIVNFRCTPRASI